MGFLTDIAEIAGLLFVTYMAGWLLGYAAHRLTARAPKLEASKATRDTAVAVGFASESLSPHPPNAARTATNRLNLDR